jgi:PAS domain S-box-containing protein
MPDLMFVINSKKEIVDYYVPNNFPLYNEPSNFLNKNIFNALPSYLANLTDNIIDKVLKTGKKEEFEYYLLLNNVKKYFYSSIVKKSEDEVLTIIRDVTPKKETEIALENELKFSSMISSLSMKFINCTEDEVDLILNKALQEVGEFLGVDRVYISEFDYQNKKMSITYQWCADNISSEINNLQNLDIDVFQDFMDLMLSKKVFKIDNVNEYKDKVLRETLERQGIKSIIICPIFIKEKWFGFVGSDSVRGIIKFSEKEIYFLKLLSNFLSSVFQKIETVRLLEINNKLLETSRIATLNMIDDLEREIQEKNEAEKRLILSEKKFRSYIEQTIGIIFVIQKNKKFGYLSPSTKNVLGYLPENLIGITYNSLIHPDDQKKIISPLRELIKTKKPIRTLPLRLRHKNGHYVWIVIQVGPILDDKGNITEMLGLAVDVTELIETQKLLNLTEQRYRSLFENQIEAYALHELIVDENNNPINYKILDVNQAFLDLTNFSDKNEIVGKTVLEIWPNIEKELIQLYGNIVLNKGKHTFEKFFPLFNKTFLINAYSLEEMKFAVSFIDITERIKSEIAQKIQLNIAASIIQGIGLKELLVTIKTELSKLVDTSNFFVARYDQLTEKFISIIFIDEKDEFENSWYAKDSLSGIIVNQKVPMILKKGDIISIENSLGIEFLGPTPEIWVGVPIISKGKIIGIIVLQSYSNPNAYNQKTVDLLKTIAAQLAVFIEEQEYENQIRLLSNAIEQSSVAVAITNKDNQFQFVNKRFLEITKYLKEEVIGKNPNILKSGSHSNKFYEEMWSALTSGQKWAGEILNKDKFGNNFWVNAIITPIVDKDGRISNYIAIEEDITEKKKLQLKIEASEKQLRTTWENSVDGMRLVDENGIIVDVNKALCEMYGADHKKIIGKPFYFMIKNYSGGGLKTFQENIHSGNIEKVKEYNLILENGISLNIEVTNSIIQLEDKRKYLYSVFRDISEKKKMIDDLIVAKEKAEEINRLKSQFFANMSHELRTPFMGILGYAELLKDKVNDLEGLSFIEGITRSSNRMIETLTNILDLTKFETGQTETTKCQLDVKLVILEICEQFKYQARLKKINITCEINLPNGFTLLTNEKMFRSIVLNIVSNAVKFTMQGSIKVNSFIDNSDFVFEVEDTGIGIPNDKLHIIFDEFRQVSEGHSRSFEGSGIGLSIVKKFTELLNGRIIVESELNKGSKFLITFPL